MSQGRGSRRVIWGNQNKHVGCDLGGGGRGGHIFDQQSARCVANERRRCYQGGPRDTTRRLAAILGVFQGLSLCKKLIVRSITPYVHSTIYNTPRRRLYLLMLLHCHGRLLCDSTSASAGCATRMNLADALWRGHRASKMIPSSETPAQCV